MGRDMKILMAVDGSPYSVKAAKYLAAHPALFGADAELHLLTVHLPIPAGLAMTNASLLLGENAISDYYREDSAAALKPAEDSLRKAGIVFKSSYKVGSIADEVVSTALREKFDVIVMGSHGHGALANVVMGSVATKVLAAAPVPVLIIR
jgi:nucleotide-binding universal stress UspA family protein